MNRCDKYDFIAALHQNQVKSYAAQQLPKTAALWWWVRGAADQIAGNEGCGAENEQRRAGGGRVVVRRPGDRRRLVLDIFSRLSRFGGYGVRLLQFARKTGSQIFDIGHHRAPLLSEENIPKVILFHQKTERMPATWADARKNASNRLFDSRSRLIATRIQSICRKITVVIRLPVAC
ncbi:hypothetical protein [Pararhizobium sp. A13]|uniref:hypothetical protein n=1 Tax=Pararhizobium sp. A13 TaxID=3133975 RepID=UPI0032443711